MKVNRKNANIYNSYESLWTSSNIYENIREPTNIDTDWRESARISETLHGPTNIYKLYERLRTSMKIYGTVRIYEYRRRSTRINDNIWRLTVNEQTAEEYKIYKSLWTFKEIYENIWESTNIDTDERETTRISESLQKLQQSAKMLLKVKPPSIDDTWKTYRWKSKHKITNNTPDSRSNPRVPNPRIPSVSCRASPVCATIAAFYILHGVTRSHLVTSSFKFLMKGVPEQRKFSMCAKGSEGEGSLTRQPRPTHKSSM